jgi:hypothetical protein
MHLQRRYQTYSLRFDFKEFIAYANAARAFGKQNHGIKIVSMLLPDKTIKTQKLLKVIIIYAMHFNILKETKMIEGFIRVSMLLKTMFHHKVKITYN